MRLLNSICRDHPLISPETIHLHGLSLASFFFFSDFVPPTKREPRRSVAEDSTRPKRRNFFLIYSKTPQEGSVIIPFPATGTRKRFLVGCRGAEWVWRGTNSHGHGLAFSGVCVCVCVSASPLLLFSSPLRLFSSSERLPRRTLPNLLFFFFDFFLHFFFSFYEEGKLRKKRRCLSDLQRVTYS